MIVRHWIRGLVMMSPRHWPGFTAWLFRARTAGARHALRKLGSTLRLLWMLGCARTLGEYEHSGWNGEFPYARYCWRGRTWIIPTGPIDREHE